jgi:hypothetical protein
MRIPISFGVGPLSTPRLTSFVFASGLLAAACGGTVGGAPGAEASDGAARGDALPNRTVDVSSPVSSDGGNCTEVIESASYNQSCAADSDCLSVGEGNVCSLCNFVCGGGTVGIAGYGQYAVDVARSVGDTSQANCNCGYAPPPCCRAGRCQTGTACEQSTPVIDASVADGALCSGAACDAAPPPPSQDAALLTGIDGAVEALGGICADAGVAAITTDGAAPDASAAVCGCTRRPTGVADPLRCPAGLGEYVSTVIGPSGGTLEIQGREYVPTGITAQVTFPPTAIATPTAIVLTETAIPPPSDLLDWSPVYRIEPVGLALAYPTSVRFPSSNQFNYIPGDLTIWFSADGSCFSPLPNSYLNTDILFGSTQALGYFVVGEPRSASTVACP